MPLLATFPDKTVNVGADEYIEDAQTLFASIATPTRALDQRHFCLP